MSVCLKYDHYTVEFAYKSTLKSFNTALALKLQNIMNSFRIYNLEDFSVELKNLNHESVNID
jgi:hypothetical protein